MNEETRRGAVVVEPAIRGLDTAEIRGMYVTSRRAKQTINALCSEVDVLRSRLVDVEWDRAQGWDSYYATADERDAAEAEVRRLTGDLTVAVDEATRASAALANRDRALDAVRARAEREIEDAEASQRYAAEINDGVMLASAQARAWAWKDAVAVLAAGHAPATDRTFTLSDVPDRSIPIFPAEDFQCCASDETGGK